MLFIIVTGWCVLPINIVTNTDHQKIPQNPHPTKPNPLPALNPSGRSLRLLLERPRRLGLAQHAPVVEAVDEPVEVMDTDGRMPKLAS